MTIRFAVLIGCCLGVAYAGVGSYGYVYEDYRILQAGASATQWSLSPRALTRWLWLADPQASHALSVGLHLVVGLLVGCLGWRLGLSRPAAVLAAGILLLHPMTVESSVYLSSRGELIAAIGILLACLCATAPRWAWPLILPALALGVLGKESAIIGLGLVQLVLAYRRPSLWAWALVVVGALAWVPLGLWRLGSLTTLIHPDDVSAGLGWQWWVLAQSTAIFRLAVLSVVSWLPVGHTVDYDYDAVVPLARVAAFVLLGVVPLVLWLHCERLPRLVLLSCAACLVILLPRLVIQTPRSYLSEHQVYVPLAFLALAGAACWEAWPQGRFRLGRITPGLRLSRYQGGRIWLWVRRRELLAMWLLLCLTWHTRTAVQTWASDLTLWRQAALMAPTKPRPVANYAVALLIAGHRAGGEAMLNRAEQLAQAPHLTPWDRREALEVVRSNRLALRGMDAQQTGRR